MRRMQLFALIASLIVLATGVTGLSAQEADEPLVVPLTVVRPDALLQECLAMVATETPEQKEARIVNATAYVRLWYPDLGEEDLRASAESLIAERCQFPPFDPPPARKEWVDGRWVAHFGEHSIAHDLYHSKKATNGIPMNVVFFGVPISSSPPPYDFIKDAIDRSGWNVPPPTWLGVCGDPSSTTVYDRAHGGADSYVANTDHMERDGWGACGNERYHVKLWSSATGDRHTGKTFGGYALGSAHYELGYPHVVPANGHDEGREELRRTLMASGLADNYNYVYLGNTHYSTEAPSGPNGAVGAYTADGYTLYLHLKNPLPQRACHPSSVVRVFEHAGFTGGCRAYDFEDRDFTDDQFHNSVGVHNRATSVIVAPGHNAYFYDLTGFGGASRTSTCLDDGMQWGFNDMASSVYVGEPNGAGPCFASFTTVRGNEYWVQANVGSTGAAVQSVHVSINGGDWKVLTKQTWGAWAASYQIVQGSTVQFRTTSSVGADGVQVFDYSRCYRWIPPVNADASVVPCAFTFDATFTNPNGNDWWVAVTVTGNKALAGVDAQVNCGTPIALVKQSWGEWAKSINVPAGAKVSFIARAPAGETDRSGGYIWPQATPTAGC